MGIKMQATNFLEIFNATCRPANNWPGPVFFDGIFYLSCEEFTAQAPEPRPAWIYAARAAAHFPDSASILQFLFPEGIPASSDLPIETSTALSNLIRSVHALSQAPGMERLEKDDSNIIILDEELFISQLQNEFDN